MVIIFYIRQELHYGAAHYWLGLIPKMAKHINELK